MPELDSTLQYGALGLLGLVVAAVCAAGLIIARAVVAAVTRQSAALERGEERQSAALERIAETTARLEVLAQAGACRYPGRGGPPPGFSHEPPTRPDNVRPISSLGTMSGGVPRPRMPSSGQ
jgi:hypothetical protein